MDAQDQIWLRCGHPKTPANTAKIGLGRTCCAICKREYQRKYAKKPRSERRSYPIEFGDKYKCGHIKSTTNIIYKAGSARCKMCVKIRDRKRALK